MSVKQGDIVLFYFNDQHGSTHMLKGRVVLVEGEKGKVKRISASTKEVVPLILIKPGEEKE